MSDIRFEHVGKRYGGDVEVIRDLNLDIAQGEFMVLVGPSGCAKSTTLRMIAGLETITAGDLWIGGVRANALSPAERNISMVFQSYALFPNMTVRENLSFGMQIRKEARATIDQEVNRIAGIVGLTPLLDRRPRQLSGGQAQRVALGRAMIRRPAAFLFDEPLSNLDAELRVQMRGEISEMQRSLGTTTVYVTHDQVEAMTLGDRVAVMDKGRIMQVGTPLDLYMNPANAFVAGFIGSPKMSFLDIAGGTFHGETVPLDAGIGGPGKRLILGVRPEHVVLNGADTDGLAFEARVVRMEDLGHEVLIRAEIPATDETVTVRTSGTVRATVQQDEMVRLSIDRQDMRVFDAETGERVQ